MVIPSPSVKTFGSSSPAGRRLPYQRHPFRSICSPSSSSTSGTSRLFDPPHHLRRYAFLLRHASTSLPRTSAKEASTSSSEIIGRLEPLPHDLFTKASSRFYRRPFYSGDFYHVLHIHLAHHTARSAATSCNHPAIYFIFYPSPSISCQI